MKLKKGFITQDIGDTQMMVAAGLAAKNFHGMVRSNCTAAFIVNCLKIDTTEQKIVEKLLQEYDTTEKVAAAGVKIVIEKLREIGAIDE